MPANLLVCLGLVRDGGCHPVAMEKHLEIPSRRLRGFLLPIFGVMNSEFPMPMNILFANGGDSKYDKYACKLPLTP